MISQILSISSGKSLKPSGKEKGVVVSSSKKEVVVKLAESTINLSVSKSDLKVGDTVSVDFSKDSVNLQKIIPKLPSPKDLIKIESSDVIRKVLSQIDQIKNIENRNLQKTLSNLSESIKNRELHISLLERSIEVLEKENASIKHNIGKKDKEIDKLISMLASLKKTLPELKKSELLIQNSNVKISVEGEFKPQIIIKDSLDGVKIVFEKLGVSQNLLKSISPKNGPFMISVTPNIIAKDAIIDVYPPKDHHDGMVDLQKTFFQSSQIKNVSPEILLDLLKDIENIKPDSLVKIDNLFNSADILGKQVPIKDGVMRLILPQLISIFNVGELDTDLLNQKLLPITDEKLSTQLTNINNDLELQKLIPQMEKILKEITSAITSENKKDIIPILFKLTGLSNENDVLKLIEGKNVTLEVPEEKSSVKNILSGIIQIINNNKNSEVVENVNNEVLASNKKNDSTTSTPGIDLIKTLNKEIVKFSEMKIQVAQIVEKVETFQNQVINEPVTSTDPIKLENFNFLRDLLTLTDQLKDVPVSQKKSILDTLSNLVKSISNGQLDIALLENNITALEAENEEIKLSTGEDNKELRKLIALLSSLKEALTEIPQRDTIVKSGSVETIVKGDFTSQLIIMDKLEDVKLFFDKHEIPQDHLKEISSKSAPFIISVSPNGEVKEAIIDVYPLKILEEVIVNKQKPLILSSQISDATPDLLLHLLKNNKNPNIISDIFSLINQLKNLKSPNNENLSKILINFAKSIASGQPNPSLLNSSINALEKESELIKINGGAENKELSKLILTLSSLKKLMPTPKNVNLEIQNNRININVEGKFKPQLLFIDKMDDVKSFLNKMKIPKDLLKKISTRNGPFMVSVTPNNSSKEATINIYPEKKQLEGVVNLQKTHFQSPQLKSVVPNQLLDLIKNIESIKSESLTDLDTILKSIGTSNVKKSLSDEIARILFPQLNSDYVDNEVIRQKLLPMMDEKLSQQLINVAKNSDIQKLDPQIDKILNELSPLITNESKKSLIPILFKLVNLTSENEFPKLLNTNSMTTGFGDEKENVKSVLIKMLQIINKAENDSAIANKGQLAKDQDLDTQRSLNEQNVKFSSIKKQVSQIIEKIEAFQVLAKSVPASSGESQLITLPVNYGGEWVDLQLRVSHKNRESSQKGDKKRVTVELNIELSAIGDVSAEMEYFKNKEIAINVTLGNKKITQWFDNNKTEMENALRKLDLNIVKLNFRSKKGFIKPKEIIHKKVNNNFDIVG